MVIAMRQQRTEGGFTIIELLVVLAAMALLLSIAAPTYLQHLDNARDVTLKQNLRHVREAIDQFHADQGRYPANLAELAAKRYLRAVPVDPVTERSDSWVVVAPAKPAAGALYDLRSGAPGKARDGTAYASW